MQTKFNVGDEVLIKARVHSFKIYRDHNENLKEMYFLDIPGSGYNLLRFDGSLITDHHEIIDGVVNESIIKALESSNSTYPKALNCCCDMNPEGGI